MKPYLVELRRSPLRWWFPLLVALDLAALFGRSRWWIGEWAQTSVQAQIPSFYFAPVLAAAAAWAGGRSARHNLHDQMDSASRPSWQIQAAQLSSTLTYGLGAYLVGVLVAAATSWSTAGPGFLWPGYLVLGAALLVTFASAGHLVGSWSRTQFTAPVLVGLGSLIAIAWLGDPTSLGLYVLAGNPFTAASLPAVLARSALALAAFLVAVTLTRRSPLATEGGWPNPARRTGTVVCCLALVVAGAGLVATRPVQVDRAAPGKPLCTSGAPALCLWPDDRKYLSQAEAMGERVRQLPQGLFVIPDAFYEKGLRSDEQYRFEDFYILEGSMWDPAQSLAGSILTASRPKNCPLPDGARFTQDYVQSSGELMMWLAMRIFGGGRPPEMHGGPPGVDLDAIAQVIHRPEQIQLEWAKQRIDKIQHAYCG
ncbi:hypothetical protein ACFRAR_37950 [Kitasatospora sp. NPDC056651]|uniref:hypothetical protein n=1 Tax=Kitasatospora sp. NPDC056651 TaxID=3345892 RepID=UPI0036B50BE2